MEQKPSGPNCFRNNVASMGFHHNDRVCMFVATQKVAIGCVCDIDPNAYCYSVLVSKGNILVSIDLCFEKKALLSFATMDALTVGDAFQSIVRWDIGSLQLMDRMQCIGMPESNEANAALDAQNAILSYTKARRIRGFNYGMKAKHM